MHRNQEAVADKTHQYAESAACKTPQQPASVARDIQIYKKVLGSRRSLATVFWSLSTATSDTQRERAFVKSVYASQHSQPKEEFCIQRSQPKEEFCPNAHSLKRSFASNAHPPNILKRSPQSWKNGKDHFINPTSLSELTAPKSPPQKHTSPCQKKPPKKAWFF